MKILQDKSGNVKNTLFLSSVTAFETVYAPVRTNQTYPENSVNHPGKRFFSDEALIMFSVGHPRMLCTMLLPEKERSHIFKPSGKHGYFLNNPPEVSNSFELIKLVLSAISAEFVSKQHTHYSASSQ